MLNGKNFVGCLRTQAYFAASLLRGDAGKWVKPLLRRSSLLDSPPELNDLDSIFHHLRLQFGEIDEELHAQKALRTLRQTKSASSYATDFQRLRLQLPTWSDDTMIT